MKKIVLFISLVLLVLPSCSKDDPGADVSDGLIAFRQSGLLFSASAETKATEATESTLNSNGFNVSCTTGSAGSESNVWNNVAFSKSGTYFVAGGSGKWWPDTNPSYHFYASNAALTFNAGGCTVAATNATDVVCAYMPSPTYKSRNTLQFKHIFARITDVTFSAADGYTISGISVTVSPKTGGTYNLRTGSGQTDGTGWSSLTTGSATAIANSTPGTKSNNLYLVPGRYVLTASWTATKGDYTKTFSNKTYEINVVGGKCNVITASLVGDASAITFSVTVNPWQSNSINVSAQSFEQPDLANGHAFVDLGLRSNGNKILFATMNVGASSPEEYGDYFAWGETSKRYTNISGSSVVGGSFRWSNCPYHTGDTYNTGWSKYIPTGKESYTVSGTADNKLVLDVSDDVASALWGGSWRMPTAEELCMLINGDGSSTDYDEADNVTYSWTDDYNGTGVHGYIITGKGSFSSASLFLPAAGNCVDADLSGAGGYGSYWPRSVDSDDPSVAWCLYFEDGDQYMGNCGRCSGLSVRPVLVIPE